MFALFPSAPEEYFGLQPSCHPLPYQLGGLGRQDGGLWERWPITQCQRHAPPVLYTREDATSWTDAGQLHGLHVIILRLIWWTGSSSYLYTRRHHKHQLDEEAMDTPTQLGHQQEAGTFFFSVFFFHTHTDLHNQHCLIFLYRRLGWCQRWAGESFSHQVGRA